MSLQDVYEQAWIQKRGMGTGWIVNLEPTYHLVLGAVGVVDGQYFNPETTLDARGVTGLALDQNQRRDDTPWQFQSDSGISVNLTSTGAIPEAPGKVGWKLSVKFGKDAGASIHGAAMWWNGYEDLGFVRTAIVEAAKAGQLHEGESVVVAQQLTGTGFMSLAESQNASLTATASLDVSPAALPIGSLAAHLAVTKHSGGAELRRFADGTVLAARLLYLGHHGWFWWRRFVAYGGRPIDPLEVEETTIRQREGDGPDEYFALL